MTNTKVDTAIVNGTQQELILRVGNQNCFAKVATIAVGGEHKLQIDINWTYQEFSLEPASAGLVLNKIILNSDDCCDYERITVTISDGKFQVDKVSRGHLINNFVNQHQVLANWRSYFTWIPRPKFKGFQRSWL